MINDTDLLVYATGTDLSDDENNTNVLPENNGSVRGPEFEEYDVGGPLDLNDGDGGNAFGIITTGFDPLEVTEAGSRIAGYITTDHRSQVRLGTYVIVPYEDEHLFARIWKLQYQQQFEVDDATEIHSRRMLRSSTTAELDYKFLAYLEPICILYEHVPGDESSLMRRMADRIPRPNTPILPVTEKLKIQTGLNIPREGIFLGHLSVGGELVRTHASPPTVPYYLRNDYSMGDPLIFRHMLICGSTGTGKTFLTKNILRQFMSEDNRYQVRDNGDGVKKNKNPCLVIMDPQDEYSQLLEDNPELIPSDEHNMNSESVRFGGVPSTKTFVAKVDGQTYSGRSRAEQTEFTIPFEMVRITPD